MRGVDPVRRLEVIRERGIQGKGLGVKPGGRTEAALQGAPMSERQNLPA